MTLEEVKAVLGALVREGVDFVVIGSMAMAAQGLPRATRDLDLFVAPEIRNLEALKRALQSLFNDPSRSWPSVSSPRGNFWNTSGPCWKTSAFSGS